MNQKKDSTERSEEPSRLGLTLEEELEIVNLQTLSPKERMAAMIGREPTDGEVEMALGLNLL